MAKLLQYSYMRDGGFGKGVCDNRPRGEIMEIEKEHKKFCYINLLY